MFFICFLHEFLLTETNCRSYVDPAIYENQYSALQEFTVELNKKLIKFEKTIEHG